MLKAVLKSTTSIFVLLSALSITTSSQAMKEDRENEFPNSFSLFQEHQEKESNRPNPKTLKTPLKALIHLANEGDEKAQEKLTNLHFKQLLPMEIYTLMEMQKWKNIEERMEKDDKFLYLGFWSGVNSYFSDYFENFFKVEEKETHPYKLLILGSMYSSGLFLEEINAEKAITFFQKALEIDEKNPLIYLHLGLCYFDNKQLNMAKYYYEEGKKLRNIECAYQLAVASETGVENEEQARQEFVFKLYHEAAVNGSIGACTQLGPCYANGTGVPANFMEALRYMIKGSAVHPLDWTGFRTF